MFVYHRVKSAEKTVFTAPRDQYAKTIHRVHLQKLHGRGCGWNHSLQQNWAKGEDRWVTILFTDLQGYSTIIEPMSPKEVLELLNDYFSQMGKIIEKHDGVVLEYIGDAMMVVFVHPVVKEHQIKAVRCAMEMREYMHNLNEKCILRRHVFGKTKASILSSHASGFIRVMWSPEILAERTSSNTVPSEMLSILPPDWNRQTNPWTPISF